MNKGLVYCLLEEVSSSFCGCVGLVLSQCAGFILSGFAGLSEG